MHRFAASLCRASAARLAAPSWRMPAGSRRALTAHKRPHACTASTHSCCPPQEYVHGMGSEIYELRCFPRWMVGMRFRDAAALLYERHGMILLGLGGGQDGGGGGFEVAPLSMVRL
jgi:hypothetical protein